MSSFLGPVLVELWDKLSALRKVRFKAALATSYLAWQVLTMKNIFTTCLSKLGFSLVKLCFNKA